MFLHFHLPLRASPTLPVRLRTTQLLRARTTRARTTRARTTRARTTQARTTQARTTQMFRARTLIQLLLPLLRSRVSSLQPFTYYPHRLPLLLWSLARCRLTSIRAMASPDRLLPPTVWSGHSSRRRWFQRRFLPSHHLHRRPLLVLGRRPCRQPSCPSRAPKSACPLSEQAQSCPGYSELRRADTTSLTL